MAGVKDVTSIYTIVAHVRHKKANVIAVSEPYGVKQSLHPMVIELKKKSGGVVLGINVFPPAKEKGVVGGWPTLPHSDVPLLFSNAYYYALSITGVSAREQ